MHTVIKEQNELFINDIREIDFSMIMLKLQEKEEGQGWSAEQCTQVQYDYAEFLALKRKYPEKEIVPTKTIDIFWHQHILDTAKYQADCQQIFGYFLHHYPYFGMNGDQDAQNLENAFEETKELYQQHFRKDYLGEAPKCKTPKCRTACKPMKCR